MSILPKKNLSLSKKGFKEISFIVRQQEEKRAKTLAQTLNLPYINLISVPIDIEALSFIEEGKSRAGTFVPFQRIEKKIAIAVLDPHNPIFNEVILELKSKDFEIGIFVCSKSSIKRAFEEYKKVPPRIKEISGRIEISNEHLKEVQEKTKSISNLDEELRKDQRKGSTWVIETILGGALALDASDVHIIPEEDHIKLQFRIDGMMHEISRLLKSIYSSFIARIKLLSNLKINIHNIAQDGRFTIFAMDKEIEVRVSVVPGEYGENIVMRVLNPNMILSLNDLGLHSWHEKTLIEEMKRPNGLILTTGPTGSGKTTTLYACLKKIADPELKVITIEDPIEYHLEGIVQTQADPQRGYDFAAGLRAAMRQDPDVILVGEIRDTDTASTAVQSALTGHLVFSTLHTNDAAGVIPRLIELGITPTAIPPALNLAIAQRLLRRVCQECKKEIHPSDSLLSKFKKKLENINLKIPKEFLSKKLHSDKIKIFEAVGCPRCNMTGYKRRIGIFEMFQLTKSVEQVILNSPSVADMKEVAVKEGMITMQEDGILRILEGVTTIDEVVRTTGLIE